MRALEAESTHNSHQTLNAVADGHSLEDASALDMEPLGCRELSLIGTSGTGDVHCLEIESIHCRSTVRCIQH